MTTQDTKDSSIVQPNLDNLTENLKKVEQLSERLTQVLAHRSTHNAALDGPNQELYSKAVTAYWNEAMRDPGKVLEHQLQFWSKSVTHFVEAQSALAQGKLQAPSDPGPKDRRFSNPLWDSHPYFNFIKQQYLSLIHI